MKEIRPRNMEEYKNKTFSIEILNKGEKLLYKDIDYEIFFDITFFPFTTFNLYELSDNFNNDLFSLKFGIILERIINFLIAHTKYLIIECRNIKDANFITENIQDKKLIDLSEWDLKVSEKNIIIEKKLM